MTRIDVRIDRRQLMRFAVGGLAAGYLPGRLASVAQAMSDPRSPRRHCILLWMSGGPSQTDTFDMKPGHANGGEFKEIQTNVPGLRFSEHFPKLAQRADRLALLRGLSTREGDHARGTYLMRTGHRPDGAVHYPTLGSSVSKQLGDSKAHLPNYVSISAASAINPAAYSPGFLGPQYAATTVGELPDSESTRQADGTQRYPRLGVDHLNLPSHLSQKRADQRMQLWSQMQADFLSTRKVAAAVAHDTVYRRAYGLLSSDAVAAFDLTDEPDALRQAYGAHTFGQGCLMARRLVERGVPFVEVNLGATQSVPVGWDTHEDNFRQVKQLSQQLDSGWATLMNDLHDRGLLERTTILWMGEFGRTPTINNMGGRDHFPAAWSCVLAGGGIRGGQAFGKTDPSGVEVVDGKVGVEDLLATTCVAAGVDPSHENETVDGRPIKITEGKPIREILATES